MCDDNPVGLGVKVNKDGSKTFKLRYRNQYGKQRNLTIGKYGAITLEQARGIAKERLLEIAKGEDPATNKKEKRESASMTDMFNRYLEEHSKINNKPSTHKGNEAFVKRYLIPALGKYKVKEVQRSDIYSLQQKLTKHSKAVANTAISILSKTPTLFFSFKIGAITE